MFALILASCIATNQKIVKPIQALIGQAAQKVTAQYNFVQPDNSLDTFLKDFYGADADTEKAKLNAVYNSLTTKSTWDTLTLVDPNLSKEVPYGYKYHAITKSTLVKDIVSPYMSRMEAGLIASRLTGYAVLYSDFMVASNVDAVKYVQTIASLAQNWDTYTVNDWLNEVGIDYDEIFEFTDKLGNTLLPGTNYDLFTFMKECFYKPPSEVDQLKAQLKYMIIDNHMSIQELQKLIDLIIKVAKTAFHCFVSRLCDLFDIFLDPIRPLIDFQEKSLPDRVNKMITNLQKLTQYPNNPDLPDLIGQANAAKFLQILTQFNGNGIDLPAILNQLGFNFTGTVNNKELFSLLSILTNHKESIYTAFMKGAPSSDYGKLNQFIVDILSFMTNPSNKLAALAAYPQKLPEYYKEIVTPYFTDFTGFLMSLYSGPIAENVIFGPKYLNNSIEIKQMENLFFQILGEIAAEAQKGEQYSTLFYENQQEFVTHISNALQLLGNKQSVSPKKIIATVIPPSLMSQQQVAQLLGAIPQIITQYNSTIYHYYHFFTPEIQAQINQLSQKLSLISQLLTIDAIPPTTLNQMAPEVTRVFGVLGQMYGTAAAHQGNITIEDFFDSCDPTFLNITGTMTKLVMWNMMNKDPTKLSVKVLNESIVIEDSETPVISFETLVPIKKLATDSMKFNGFGMLTASVSDLAALLGFEPQVFAQLFGSILTAAGSEDNSLINLINTEFGVNIKYGSMKFSNVMLEASQDKPINSQDLNEAFIEFNNAVQGLVDSIKTRVVETTKKRLADGAIAGIVLGCVCVIFTVIVITTSMVVYKKKEPQSLLQSELESQP